MAPWYWALGLAGVAVLWLLGKRRLAQGAATWLSLLVVAQSLVYAAAFWAATTLPGRPANPTDLYCTAALVAIALTFVCLLGFALLARRSSSQASVGESLPPAMGGWKLRALFLLIGGLGFVSAASTQLSRFSLWESPKPVSADYAILACVLTAVAAGAWLASRSLRDPDFRLWMSHAGLVGLGVLAGFALPASVLTTVEPRLMTDASLVRALLRADFDGDRAERLLRELEARRYSERFSSLSSILAELRPGASRRAQEHADAYRTAHEGHSPCNSFPGGPSPLYEDPQLALLRLAISRGELDEPHAWASDFSVPTELKADLRYFLEAPSAAAAPRPRI